MLKRAEIVVFGDSITEMGYGEGAWVAGETDMPVARLVRPSGPGPSLPGATLKPQLPQAFRTRTLGRLTS